MEPILYFTKKMHSFAGKILYMNLFGMMLLSLLDGVGIFLLIPMLSVSGIGNINAGKLPLIGKLEFLTHYPMWLGLSVILGIYFLMIAGQAVLQRNLSFRDMMLNTGFINQVRLETYRSILHSNWEFFIKRRKSDLVNSLTEEIERVTNGTQMFMQFQASLVFTLIQIGLAFWLSAKLTVFVLLCGLLVTFISRKYIKKSRMLGYQRSELARNYLGGITDHFNGIKEIKSNMLEASRYQWLNSWCQNLLQERYDFFKVRMNSQLFYKVSSTLFITIFMFSSVMLFHTQGEQLLLVILIFARLWPRFAGLQSNLEQIAASIPAFKAVKQLQEEGMKAREIKDGTYDGNHVIPVKIEQGLECRQVNFRYNRDDKAFALQDISLQIAAKHMTAIVGRSGAGKSTLVDILMGLMQPEEGQVLIDGVPITSDNLMMSLRRAISYVPQDPFLFNGSIKENLLLMEPNATEEEIWGALELSAAAEFVRRLPRGLDTLIGDRGIRLSGGERQRLVLARAILRKPAVLVLDEATSALDTENETKIQEALENLKGTMTIIVIAHRLSTVRNADQVIVLDQGKIIQKGGFTQLAREKGGLFSKFLGNQIPDSDSRIFAAT